MVVPTDFKTIGASILRPETLHSSLNIIGAKRPESSQLKRLSHFYFL